MGCFDVFCIVCGNTTHPPSHKISQCPTSWLGKCTLLLPSGVVHGCTETGCSVEFTDKTGTTYYLDEDDGLFVHTSCYQFVKKEYGVAMSLATFPSKVFHYKKNKALPLRYGDIEKYWGQNFRVDRLIADGKSYYLCNPLTNTQNAKRIKTIMDQVIKKQKRPASTQRKQQKQQKATNTNLWNKFLQLFHNKKTTTPSTRKK